MTCPNHFSLRLFTVVKRSSYGPARWRLQFWLSLPHWLCDLCTRYRGVCVNISSPMPVSFFQCLLLWSTSVVGSNKNCPRRFILQILCMLQGCQEGNSCTIWLFPIHLDFVHPLQDVALHQCPPLSSVCCFPNPGGSLLLCYVILPSFAWSSPRPLPSPWLPLCASLCPPIVLLFPITAKKTATGETVQSHLHAQMSTQLTGPRSNPWFCPILPYNCDFQAVWLIL